jgi:hypothetical protein
MLFHIIFSVESFLAARAVDGPRIDMLGFDMTHQDTFMAERTAVLAVYPAALKRAVWIPDKIPVNASFQCDDRYLTLACWFDDYRYGSPE